MSMLSRRQILVSAGVTLASAVAGAAYGFLVEPDWFEVTHHEVPTRWLRDGSRIRILHLSDLHASPAISLDRIESAMDLGLKMKPDLICLTGDYITDTVHPDLNTYKKLLAKLSAVAPTYASTGNHDGGRWGQVKNRYPSSELIRNMLSSAGIVVPHNAHAEAEIAGERIQIVGIGDHWAKEQNARKAFNDVSRDADCLRITLSHNPDTKEILQYFSWELMLSGHTHGGQVVIPGYGPPILPVNDHRYYQGLHTWQGRRIYITRGVGGVAGGIRIACRPEVTILDLVPGESPVELTESKPRKT